MNDAETVDPTKSNLGVAFALVIGAGAATGLGAAVVFFPRLVRLASRKTLAAALGLSAGVMTYVSFVEILGKSTSSFEEAGYDPEKEAYVYSTLSFFAGVVSMMALNSLVTWLLGGHHHNHQHHDDLGDTREISAEEGDQNNNNGRSDNNNNIDGNKIPCPCQAEDPVSDLQNVHNMAEEIENAAEEWGGKGVEDSVEVEATGVIGAVESDGEALQEDDNNSNNGSSNSSNDDGSNDPKGQDNKKLMQMSLNTALAIGIHNFPEGLATFVAALADPSVGAVLAIAIAIHNIPEGLCVAMPVYYATGQRWKAFGWAMLSGIAEPIAALFGWAVLGAAGDFSPSVYGVLFGLVAGMMVIISARELLPTAHRYDPEDSVVTLSFIGGMVIMALSLVLFVL